MSIGHMRKFAVKKCKWRKKDPSLMILCSQANKSLLVIGQGSSPHPHRSFVYPELLTEHLHKQAFHLIGSQTVDLAMQADIYLTL